MSIRVYLWQSHMFDYNEKAIQYQCMGIHFAFKSSGVPLSRVPI